MHKYKAIFLIISSEDLEVYKQFKTISQKYYDLFPQDMKYFYMEMDENLDEDIKEVGNHLYVKGKESHIPAIYIKTRKAIEYVNKHYDYDFIFRPNLSSFYNVPNILKFLDALPKQNFAGGFCYGHDGGFITGTGIFMSRDIANILTQETYDDLDIPDDVLIARILMKNRVTLHCIRHIFKWPFFEYDHFDESAIEVADNIIYYRIKAPNDRNNDVRHHKYLLNKIYGITMD